MSLSNRRRGQTLVRKRTLEDTLLNEEERAALEAIDASLSPEEKEPTSHRIYQCLAIYCCNRASFALLLMLTLSCIGAILFGITKSQLFEGSMDSSTNTAVKILRQVGAFLFSAGLFGFFGGCANLIALIMLFYEFPLLYGTGVIQRQYKQIGNVICRIVIQMLFDGEHLKNYIVERISKFSIEVNVMESIARALSSRKASAIIDSHMDDLYSQPESQYLIAMGISRSLLMPMIRPAILSLCAETAPLVLTHDNNTGGGEHTVSIPRIRNAISGFLTHRVQTLSKKMISSLMRELLFRHLIGLIMYGCIMGCLVGLLAQALKFSLNPELGS